MSKLSEMMENIENQTNEKSKSLEQHLDQVYNQQQRSIENMLERNLSSTEASIKGYIKRISKIILKSWMVWILSGIMVLAILAGIGYLQGRKIISLQQQIKNQEKTLQTLDSWGISTVEGEGERYLVFPREIIPETGYQLDGKEYVKLKEKE